ncbi:xanthine dehydrogenase accessory protein XdhC [Curtobacterium sp. S6]|uniref:xanthine dehydrogenase accessory protein XdhC n=1 Tax=Curtobacterium sp. S6 TaxID=1479623 RepID=UPI0004AA33DD|nr:xanthine dehydrogenase accessory protein XdhC [Curtobacterium sp. S6]
MQWLTGLQRLHDQGAAGVLVTLTSVRGHSPRGAGAKMVVTAEDAWDTIGGGNLEATLTDRARQMIADRVTDPVVEEVSLNEHAATRYGQQCCGGKVTVLLEPIAAPPVVAIFGAGHVGLEIVRSLSRLPVALHLVDSRPGATADARAVGELDGAATLRVIHAPAPEAALNDLPAGSHVLIMSHDHSEDLIMCDTALRRDDLGMVGLIGSSAKWARFRKKLGDLGHDQVAIDRISCPIGIPGITGKSPAVIAISVAAALVEELDVA